MEQESNVYQAIFKANELKDRIFINRLTVTYWIEELVDWLFCKQEKFGHYRHFNSKGIELTAHLKEFLIAEKFSPAASDRIAVSFFRQTVGIHTMLLEDLEAIIAFDPAAKSKNEVLLAYPGFYALSVFRIAHELSKLGSKVLPRIVSEHAHSKTGIDIHPSAKIGRRFFIDHGTGIVIGETAKIGNDVKMYQGVTLGALSVSKDKAHDKRHPTIEDSVTIYANATILGGKTTIGRGAIIGGNVWITASIPASSLVYHKSEIVVKNKKDFPEALNFSI